MKKLVWAVVVLFLLLQTVSNQEDLTEEDLAEEEVEETADTSKNEEEPASPPFQPPSKPSGDVYFAESFTDEEEVWKVWVTSKATTEDNVAKYDGKRH